MKNNQEHIDYKEIKSYLEGKMSRSQKNSFEKKAQLDPFLSAALDGYHDHPDGFKIVEKRIIRQKKINKSFFGARTLLVLSSVALLYVLVLFINFWREPKPELISSTSNIEENEVDVLPLSIDSLSIVDETDQNSISEIVENKQKIQKHQKEQHDIDTVSDQNEDIIIHELPEVINPLKIEEELNNKGKTLYAPSIYIEDLYVVDYRNIKRESKKIKYTRYVTSGLSANFEDASSQNSTDLIEQEVEIPYMEYLRSSMEFFSQGKFKNALNRYLTIIEQYPDDLNAHFYGAHCYYNMNKYPEALAFFQTCIQLEEKAKFVAFKEEVNWYTAKTLLKLGKRKEAIKTLDEIIIGAQFYAKDAIILKKNL